MGDVGLSDRMRRSAQSVSRMDDDDAASGDAVARWSESSSDRANGRVGSPPEGGGRHLGVAKMKSSAAAAVSMAYWSAVDVDNHATTNLAIEQVARPSDRRLKAHLGRRSVNLGEIQEARKPSPRGDALVPWTRHAVHTQQADAAKDERSHRRRKVETLRHTAGGYSSICAS